MLDNVNLLAGLPGHGGGQQHRRIGLIVIRASFRMLNSVSLDGRQGGAATAIFARTLLHRVVLVIK
jgi:hypothetical protein